MTSNTKDRVVELAIKLHDFLLQHSGKDTTEEDYKLQISSDDLGIIKEFDGILTELHKIIAEERLK